MRAAVPSVLTLLLLAACQGGGQAALQTGLVQPTVAGVPPAAYGNLAEGRTAFRRVGGSLTAVLEDAAWLRFEGDPACVEQNHRAYFEYGYTTFQVELRSREFTQPTCEEFVLEDNLGARIPGRPLRYEGSPVLVDDRYFSRFSLSFQHMITRRIAWIRLTRVADGSSVEWQFAHAQPARPATPCPPASSPATSSPAMPCPPPPAPAVSNAPLPCPPGSR